MSGTAVSTTSRRGSARAVYNLLLRAVDPLLAIESTGMKLNLPELEHIGERLVREIEQTERELRMLVALAVGVDDLEEWIADVRFRHLWGGFSLNPHSSRSMQILLQKELKMIKPDKHGVVSTGAKILQGFIDRGVGPVQVEIAQAILKYRQLKKLQSSYIKKLPRLVGDDGRLRTVYKLTSTVTGRLSSGDERMGLPNMQNVAGKLKTAFIAEEGWTLLNADMSQAEIRVLSHFAQDARLDELLASGVDTHIAMACMIWSVTPEQVTHDMRKRAKTMSFACLYGQGEYARAQQLGITVEEARKLEQQYFAAMPAVREWKRKTEQQALSKGYVGYSLGRRRRFLILPTWDRDEAAAQIAAIKREASNACVQGTASDITLVALCEIYEHYKNDPEVRLVATVHDSIVLEVRPWRVSEVADFVHQTMTSVPSRIFGMTTPFAVEIEEGSSWGAMQPLVLQSR